jgi:flagellar M-ring protein FliF
VVENPGRVRRLTAAIVVNDRVVRADAKGFPAQWQPRSLDELHNLTSLAQAAVGFDGTRGDVVTVQDLAFDENRGAPPASLLSQLLSKTENSPVLVKYATLLLGLLVVLTFGVRPALRKVSMAAAEGAKPGKGSRQLPAQSAAPPALNPPEPPSPDPERIRAQEIFEQVSDHLQREPTQSSRLLQSWIHSE